jgi:hypothetical protein
MHEKYRRSIFVFLRHQITEMVVIAGFYESTAELLDMAVVYSF